MKFTCGRRAESFRAIEENQDTWLSDDSCSYCGSLNPATFMARVEAGTVKLEPTDKNYKVYVNNDGGESFKQSYRTDDDRSGDQSKWVWTTRETDFTKFYFQHLDEAQCRRFIDLLNAKSLKFTLPGYFYVRPFFMAPAAREAS